MMARPIHGRSNVRMMAHPVETKRRAGTVSRTLSLGFVAAILALSTIAAQLPATASAHSNTSAQSGKTEAQRIVAIAASHIGAHFRMGAVGPRVFDCSGFIYAVYKTAGLLSRIGGSRRVAAGYYHWFKAHGKASRGNPQVGDLVVWKEHGKIAHSGIYVGNGQVISALINPWGVKRTHITGLHAKFFAFLHVNLAR